MITIKTEEQLALMRIAGKIASETLSYLSPLALPGVTTKELDLKAEEFIRDHGAIPSCKGYHGFPASVCISVNHQAVHCIPSALAILKESDVLKLDLIVSYEGWNADTALTLVVPPGDDIKQAFVDATRQSLYNAIPNAIDGNHVSDLSNAVHAYATSKGYGVVKEFVGHGIGQVIHEEPKIPNFKIVTPTPKLVNGMVVCIEPILTMSPESDIFINGWDTWTKNGSLVAHFEHTIAITPNGPEILTIRKEEQSAGTGISPK